MPKVSSPNPSDVTEFLRAFLEMLRQMYAKQLFEIPGVRMRLLPLVLSVWGVLLVVTSFNLEHAGSAFLILFSILFPTSIYYL